jgi:hypothetical protein
MIPLVMIMLDVFVERMPEGGLPTQDQPRETFLLDRAHPALRMGIQIRRPRRECHSRDPGGVKELLKGGAIFSVPIMDEVLPG